MGQPPRPRPSRTPRPEPPARKKPPLALIGILAGAAVAVIGVLFVALGGKEKAPAPLPEAPAPKPAAPDYVVEIHQQDAGNVRQVQLLVVGRGKGGPADYVLADGQGRSHKAAKGDPREFFLREFEKEPGALALTFSLPGDATTLDLKGPGDRTIPVSRPVDPERLRPMAKTQVQYEGWHVICMPAAAADGALEIEVRAQKAVADAEPLDPKRFFLVTDEGKSLPPEVKSAQPPFKLRYAVPKTAREVRLQTFFRGVQPLYLVHELAPKKETARPVEEKKPDTAAPPPPPGGSLRAEFEAQALKDPVAALRLLSEKNSDEARALARDAVARIVAADIDAGVKAFQDGQAEAAEKHLVRAALLSDAYAPELSRQLMRMYFLMKPQRKTPTGCASCKGAGAAACASCQKGFAQGACPRCEAKGQVNCLLCDGSGQMDHHGYKGTLVLVLEKDTKAKDEKGRSGTLPAQTVTYRMSPCDAGQFQLHTENVVTKTGAKGQENLRHPCLKFWNQMKMFVFSGRAKIQIMSRQGKLVAFSSTAARRFFADYENCKGGRVVCDRCTGRKTDVCGTCAGKGQAALLCRTCEGSSLQACAACRGYGDATWLSKLLPPSPALQQQLGGRADAIRGWLDERARLAGRKELLAAQLAEAKKGLDPSAKLTPDYLDLLCPRCKANGSECEECWATGRREYYEGTSQYERYALAQKLERQLKEALAGGSAAPAFAALAPEPGAAASGSVASAPKPPPIVVPPNAPIKIPGSIEEIIKEADRLHETGKKHLEASKASNDNAVWIDEGIKAVGDLRNAQTLYATAQEKLDAAGTSVPRELIQKFRINMQALVMARKQVP
jgi:hypothetical protein